MARDPHPTTGYGALPREMLQLGGASRRSILRTLGLGAGACAQS
jgi:hypothetical protein